MLLLNKHVDGTPSDAVYIGRGSTFGNLKVIGQDGTREEVIAWYRGWLRNKLMVRDPKIEKEFRALNENSRLLCFCHPKPCHGQVIIDYWNEIHSHADYETGLLEFKKKHLASGGEENLAYRDWLTKKLIQRDPQVSIDFRRLELTRALIPDEFRGTGGTGKVILDIYNKIISTGDYDEGLLLYAKKYGTDPVYTPVNDGIDHINVYSKARTKIGVALSNFALTPFDHPKHGKFQSVEGFWYWLATGKQHEELRTLYGYKAKEIGKKFPRVQIDDFIPEIKKALLLKFEQNKELAQDLARTTLPLTHYYYYGDIHNAKVIPETKATWFVEYLETIRRYLKGEAYKIIIAGSRGIDQLETVKRAYRESGFEAVEIVSGGARGVDRLGEELAKELQLPVERFIPNWDAQGRAAGMIRNHRMGDYAGALVACWDGTSPGTKDMIDYMKKLAKPSYVLMTQAVPS